MHLVKQTQIGQPVEVAPDGHVPDGQLARQVADPDRPPLADPFDDVGLAFPREHRYATSSRTTATEPAVARTGPARQSRPWAMPAKECGQALMPAKPEAGRGKSQQNPTHHRSEKRSRTSSRPGRDQRPCRPDDRETSLP